MDLNLTDLVFLLIITWVVCLIGARVMDVLIISQTRQKITILKRLTEIIHQVKIEKVNDTEYWYDEHNDQFLAQGSSLDEIIDVLKARFPEHIFLLDGKGGICSQTNWKLMDPAEFRSHVESGNVKPI